MDCGELQWEIAWTTTHDYAARAGYPPKTKLGCHTFRATGITAYLENGDTLKHALPIAAYQPRRTRNLCDRTTDRFTLDEIEPIAI